MSGLMVSGMRRLAGAVLAVLLAGAGSTAADAPDVSQGQALAACHKAVRAELLVPGSADFGVSWITHQHGVWDIGANFTADNHAGDIADAVFGCTVDADGKVTTLDVQDVLRPHVKKRPA